MSDTFYKRLISLKKNGENNKEFASRIGLTEQVLYKWRKGQSPGSDLLIQIQEKTGVSLHWLMTGWGTQFPQPEARRDARLVKDSDIKDKSNSIPGEMETMDYIHVPLIEGRVTAGLSGGILLEDALDHYPFKRGWAVRRISHDQLHLDALVLVRVQGESMHPTISSGELILVDTWQEERMRLRPGGIYLARLPDDSIAVKRLLLITDDRPRLVYISDNPSIQAFEFEVPEGRELHHFVLGRVRWAGREFD